MVDILLVVGVTLLVAFVFGEALERVGEPALVGEIIAGLVLGPSIIGLIDYDETFAVFGMIGAMLFFSISATNTSTSQNSCQLVLPPSVSRYLE
ncbi:hypothetical protein [Halobellus limi]|uniref:hypothetical protein n=1 Tax=Halobellus limi TaxID=699433 RepID=UPI001F2C1123|nr:hypothetical protein [Halobellus limi]